MEWKIIHATFFNGRKWAEVARRLGAITRNCDNQLRAAFRSLRLRFTPCADVFTDVDCPRWYARVEELGECYAATARRRACIKKGERSKFGGERSKFGGERGKDFRAGAA